MGMQIVWTTYVTLTVFTVGIFMTKLLKLKELNKEIKACHACPGMNIKGVTENAPGYGNPKSKVMIVGQSLCGPCIKTQIPFTGGSGEILDAVFDKLKIEKANIFITNVVHCHPPSNRPSTPHEIDKCSIHLMNEVEIIRPRLIMPLGRDAMNKFRPDGKGKFDKSKVTLFCGRGYVVHPMYHPAYYYRRGGIKNKETQEYIERMATIIGRWL